MICFNCNRETDKPIKYHGKVFCCRTCIITYRAVAENPRKTNEQIEKEAIARIKKRARGEK